MRAHFATYRLVLSVTHTAQTVNSKGQVRNRVGMGMEEGTTWIKQGENSAHKYDLFSTTRAQIEPQLHKRAEEYVILLYAKW